jgi:hypothetical protein
MLGLGLALAIPTGIWQYVGGILSQDQPVPGGQLLLDLGARIPLYLYYRLHYIGATLLLFSVAAFATAWWTSGRRRIWLPRGWRASALTSALPRALRTAIMRRLGFPVAAPAPGSVELVYYESLASFPAWAFAIGLITITGLVKALRYVWPVPGPILFVASTLHVAAMVAILVLLLDQLRFSLAEWWRGLRPLYAALVILWALANLVIGYVFVISAFAARTATKEGLPAQAALLLGGLAVAALSALLIWRSARSLGGAPAAG